VDPDSEQLFGLLDALRPAGGSAERRFILLNRTRDSVPFHAAVLGVDGGLAAHSGSSQVDASGPYAQWVAHVLAACAGRPAGPVQAQDLDAALASGWGEWWPAHALWLPAPQAGTGWLLVRDAAWTAPEQEWLARWWSLWLLAEQAAQGAEPRKAIDLRALVAQARAAWPQWRRSRKAWAVAGALVVILLFPVRMTVRAPGELVAREPTVLRAAVDGMAEKLHVEPNQAVKAGQLIAVLDDAAAASRLQVARQSLATAEAEWRQTMQQALTDTKAKAQLAVAQGRVEERRTEAAYLGEQVRRTEVRAPHDGVVLVDDPGNWAGRTVAAGEPLLRLARADDQEVEAWLPVGDAVDLPNGSSMRLFLASRPASPVRATLRLYSYEPVPRPDGGLAYRLRGRIEGQPQERLGARGTVHVDGAWVPFFYWVLRRPLATFREVTGW
jgi:hypothetical protein